MRRVLAMALALSPALAHAQAAPPADRGAEPTVRSAQPPPRVSPVPGLARDPVRDAIRAEQARRVPADERPLWFAIEAGDLDAVDREIARLKQERADWQSSPEVAREIARLQFERARRVGSPRDVLRLADESPALFQCPDADRLWSLADAALALGTPARAVAAYRTVVTECPKAADRRYTLELAARALTALELEQLIALERARARTAAEDRAFQDLLARLDLDRLQKAIEAGDQATVARLSAVLGTQLRQARQAPVATRLGWFHLARENPEVALEWFRIGAAHGGDNARFGAAVALERLGRADEAERTLESLRQPTPDSHRLLAALRLSRAGKLFEAGRLADARVLLGSAETEPSLSADARRLRGGIALRQADQAAEVGEFERAIAFAEEAQANPETADDGRRAHIRFLAGQAAALSERGDAAAARAKLDAAEALLIQAGTPDDAALAPARLAVASAAYELGDYARAAARAQPATQAALTRRDALTVLGWSSYRLGRYHAAAAAFRSSWDEAPDAAAADGLVLSLAAAGDTAAIERLAAAGGALGERARRSLSDAAAARGDYLTALAQSPADRTLLRGIDQPSVSAGYSVRSRTGDPGLGQLLDQRETLGATVPIETGRLGVALDHVNLDAGQPSPGALLGTPGLPRRFAPTTSLDGFAPRLRYDREGVWSPSLELTMTPSGGVADPVPAGSLALGYRQGDGGVLQGTLFATPRRDSLLSLAGIRDPATGVAFGRVLEVGGRLATRQPLSDDSALALEGGGARLIGLRVEDNTHYFARVGVGYELNLDDFRYFSVGPVATYDGYDKDENRFTFGNGGYYSPRRRVGGGVALNFATADGRDFVARGGLEATWVAERLAGAPLVRLAPSPGFVAGRDNSGPAAAGNLEAAWRLTEHIQVGSAFGFIVSNDFTEVAAGVFLRVPFGGRAALFSTDLDR